MPDGKKPWEKYSKSEDQEQKPWEKFSSVKKKDQPETPSASGSTQGRGTSSLDGEGEKKVQPSASSTGKGNQVFTGFSESDLAKLNKTPEQTQREEQVISFKKELQKGKEKGAVLSTANKSALETQSPFEQSYKQEPVNQYKALGVPETKQETVVKTPDFTVIEKTAFAPTKEKIEKQYADLQLDNPKPFLSASTYNRQPINGIPISKDNFVDEVFGDDKLISLGIDPADFDGYLNMSGFKDEYNQRKNRGDFDPSINADHDSRLAGDLYKKKLLSNYINTINDRALLKSKLESVKGSYEGKKIPVNKNAKAVDNQVLSTYIDENLPSLSKKIKEKDQINKEKYQELVNDNTGLNSLWIGTKNTLKGGVNSFLDAVNKSTTTVLDIIGADSAAEDLRYLNEERQLERPTERQVAFASGKVVNLNGKKYLVDEKGTIYDKDNEIVVNDLLDQSVSNKILEGAKKSKEDDWFLSPQGAAVQTGNVVGDMVWQLAYQATIGRATKGIGAASNIRNIRIPKSTADAIIAQSSLGYSQAYETALKEGKDAGLTDIESQQIASDAAQRTAAWYALTAPISPQTKATEAIFGSAEKDLIKKAVQAYKEKGKSGFISSITKGLKEIPKKAVGFTEEGGKELIQEDIQQLGEAYWINAEKNLTAGEQISDETMSFDDFVNTSILSLLSGGITASVKMPEFSGNKRTQVRNLYQLSQNMDVLDSNLNNMVENKVITREDADKVKNDAIAVSRNINRIPKDTKPEVQLDIMRKLNDIDNLEDKKKTLDKSFHASIDEEIQQKRSEIETIYNDSKKKPEQVENIQENSLPLFEQLQNIETTKQKNRFLKNNTTVAFVQDNLDTIIDSVEGAQLVEC